MPKLMPDRPTAPTNLTVEEIALLREVERGSRPGGYKVGADNLARLVAGGLVALDARLTDAGRKALEDA
jgi:hypothetical protein